MHVCRVIEQEQRTPLHHAARNGESETARLLLAAKADVLARDEVGMCGRDVWVGVGGGV